MNCHEVMELMQRQLDNDLDESESAVLMNHTRQCPDCAAMFERLKLLSAELTSLPKVMPSYSLVDAIMPELERIDLFGQYEAAAETPSSSEEEEASEILPRRVKRDRRFPSLKVMGGVIAAGIVAGFFLLVYPPGSGNEFFGASDKASETADMSAFNGDVGSRVESTSKAMVDSLGMSDANANNTSPMNVDEYALKNPEIPTLNPKSSVKEAPATAPVDISKDVQQEDGSGNNAPIDSMGLNGSTVDDEGEQSGSGKKDSLSVVSSVYSPNHLYFAKAVGYTIKIYSASDETLVFETDRKNGKTVNLVWSEDSIQLSYEVQAGKGAIEKYVFDVESGQDNKAEY